MAFVMVGRLCPDLKNDIGYRILSDETMEFKDVPIQSCINALRKGNKIINLGLDSSGKLYGTNGKIDRYGIVSVAESYVILRAIEDDNGTFIGFEVSNCNGVVIKIQKEALIKIITKHDMIQQTVDTINSQSVPKSQKQLLAEKVGARMAKDGTYINCVAGVANAKLNNGVIQSIAGGFRTVKASDIMKEKERLAEEKKRVVEEERRKAIQEEQKKANGKSALGIKLDIKKKADIEAKKTGKDSKEIYREKLEEYANNNREKVVTKNGNSVLKVRDSRTQVSILDVQNRFYDGLKYRNPDGNGLTVEEKMRVVEMILYAIDPFIYAVFFELDRIPCEEGLVDTLAVSGDGKLYYSCEFVSQITAASLTFIVLHEVYHIMMRHNSRQGKRNHAVYNTAADLYINKLICEQFSISPGSGRVRVDDPNHNEISIRKETGPDGNEVVVKGCVVSSRLPKDPYIEFGAFGLYSDKIDTNKMSVEDIYAELMKNKPPESEEHGQGQGGQDDGQGDGQGNGQSQGQSQKHGQKQGKKQGQGQGNGQSSDGDCGENGENKIDEKTGSTWHENTREEQEMIEMAKRAFGGSIVGKPNSDLVKDSSSVGKQESVQEAEADGLLRRATVKAKQIGCSSGSFGEEVIKMAMKTKVDFRPYIRKALLSLSERERSLKTPERRFVSQGLYLPGVTQLDPNKLKGVVIGIDVSGSIGKDELAEALGAVLILMKQFKAEGTIVFWDTSVVKTMKFSKKEDVMKAYVPNGGGTDVTCLFEYISNKKKFKEEVTFLIVITDGYFSLSNKAVYAQKYRDKTLWIIDDRNFPAFKAPFGKAAQMMDEDRIKD